MMKVLSKVSDGNGNLDEGKILAVYDKLGADHGMVKARLDALIKAGKLTVPAFMNGLIEHIKAPKDQQQVQVQWWGDVEEAGDIAEAACAVFC